MKKSKNTISFFFISWGLSALLMLTRDINGDLLKITLFSLGAGIIATIIYSTFRKQLLEFYRRYFDKNYRYSSTVRPKRR